MSVKILFKKEESNPKLEFWRDQCLLYTQSIVVTGQQTFTKPESRLIRQAKNSVFSDNASLNGNRYQPGLNTTLLLKDLEEIRIVLLRSDNEPQLI
jgi:hypothetical protein